VSVETDFKSAARKAAKDRKLRQMIRDRDEYMTIPTLEVVSASDEAVFVRFAPRPGRRKQMSVPRSCIRNGDALGIGPVASLDFKSWYALKTEIERPIAAPVRTPRL
jgi:hypothetical protein